MTAAPQQPDLFSAARYPERPGSKARDTARQAAEKVESKAATVRAKVRLLFEQGEQLTADECALRLGESILTVRPRLSELAALGEIVDSSQRRDNDSGHSAIVWRKTSENEAVAARAAWRARKASR